MRKSEEHLPKYFRTESNKKFLSSTFDQLIQSGDVNIVNGYIGRKTTRNFDTTDFYIKDINNSRQHKQLEPACVIRDDVGNVIFYKDYNDYINYIKNQSVNATNQSRLCSQEHYAWDPKINWDKLINYHQYYWLENGPPEININDLSIDHSSTDRISYKDGFVFGSYQETNPSITMYRGVKYTFDINTHSIGFNIRTTGDYYPKWEPNTQYVKDDVVLYDNDAYICVTDHTSSYEINHDFWQIDNELSNNVSKQNVSSGRITVTLDGTTPDILFYVSSGDARHVGIIYVKDVENNQLDVDADIIGKTDFYLSNGSKISNGMKVRFGDRVVPEHYRCKEYIINGVGNKIKLFPVNDFCTKCTSDIPDYITIEQTSSDGNSWSRNNRWYHRSVIEQAYSINNEYPVFDNAIRAVRPIIEFSENLRLYNHGTERKATVDLVDDYTRDIFKEIQSKNGYNIDGISVVDGMRILFTREKNTALNNRIFQIKMINMGDTVQISLVEVPDSYCYLDHTITVLYGDTYGDNIVWLSDEGWKIGQKKLYTNQEPLFMVYDRDGVGFNNEEYYPFSTFKGTKYFSYKKSDTIDTVLGFGTTYQSIENVGDIIFSFDYNSEYIEYKPEINDKRQLPLNSGVLRQYEDRVNYTEIDSYNTVNESVQYVNREYETQEPQQSFNLNVDQFDNDIQLYINSEFIHRDHYQINQINGVYYLDLYEPVKENSFVLVKIKPKKGDQLHGLYDIPVNLESNPLNGDFEQATFSEISNHVKSMIEKTDSYIGKFPGINNLRDIGNISRNGDKIIKNSSPMPLVMYSLLNNEHNLLVAIEESGKEYERYKQEFLNLTKEVELMDNKSDMVDKILFDMTRNKTRTNPFYSTDMVAFSAPDVSQHTVKNKNHTYFPLSNEYLVNSKRGVLYVYLNDRILVKNQDYIINENGMVAIHCERHSGDVVILKEYEHANGSYMPATPAKLGLFPCHIPKVQQDALDPTKQYILAHDGSKNETFGDYRDDLLLELEIRIYNNIKVEHANFYDINQFLPGKFREVGISSDDLNSVLMKSFVDWAAKFGGEYSTNKEYRTEDPFTYNYSTDMGGTWKNIYRYYFDTETPHYTPWEMFGFTDQPSWWEAIYGPAPYTRNNMLLWYDAKDGLAREPDNHRIIERYKRPDIFRHIPVGEKGELINPLACNLADVSDIDTADKNYIFGDGSPLELQWKDTSIYRFSLLRAFILNFPTKFFELGFDISRQTRGNCGKIKYNTGLISTKSIIFPSGQHESDYVFTSGLVNYIRDYYVDTYDQYKENIKNIEVRLGSKLAGYTTKEKFNLFFDAKRPSNNPGMNIPYENYNIILNSSTPIKELFYSAIILKRVPEGFVVFGYNLDIPYFNIAPYIERTEDKSITVGGIEEDFVNWRENKTYIVGTIVRKDEKYYRVTKYHTTSSKFDSSFYASLPYLPQIGGETAKIHEKFNDSYFRIPYGTTFSSVQDVVDFLLGYGHFLNQNGFVFDHVLDNGAGVSNWNSAVVDFLSWVSLSSFEYTILSPGSKQLKIKSKHGIIKSLLDSDYEIINMSGAQMNPGEYTVDRTNPSEIVINSIDEDGIYAASFEIIQKENVLVLDNTTNFNDAIYQPEVGFRQPRLKVSGYLTGNWDGGLNIPGFLYDKIELSYWKPWTRYNAGVIVKYKEYYYQALYNVEPSHTFDQSNWSKRTQIPEGGLLPNMDYKVNQFDDFFSLDTENFDKEQQKFAQHLIGYQQREYLKNIVENDVSQYKLYQGFIKEKGTINALDKMFGPLSEDVSVTEEWAIKTGQYGAVGGIVELSYEINNTYSEPQTLKITDGVSDHPHTIVIKPRDIVTHQNSESDAFLPEITESLSFLPDIGYVYPDHVRHIVRDYANLMDIDPDQLKIGDYLWVTSPSSWNVLELVRTNITLTNIKKVKDDVITATPSDVIENNCFIFIKSDKLSGIVHVDSVTEENITLSHRLVVDVDQLPTTVYIARLEPRRTSDASDANDIVNKDNALRRLWVDNGYNWRVIERDGYYQNIRQLKNQQINKNLANINVSFIVDKKNTQIIVARPDDSRGRVFVYRRTSDRSNYSLSQIIQSDSTNLLYGDNIKCTNDNRYLIISHSTSTENSIIRSGRIDIYARDQKNKYVLHKSLYSPEPTENEEFGRSFSLYESGSYVLLYVISNQTSSGRVWIYKNGIDSDVSYDWESAIDKRFKGDFQAGTSYSTGDIVNNNGLYEATETIINPARFDLNSWERYNSTILLSDNFKTSDYPEWIDYEYYRLVNIECNNRMEVFLSYKSIINNQGIVLVLSLTDSQYTVSQKLFDGRPDYGYQMTPIEDGVLISSVNSKDDKDVCHYLTTNGQGEYVVKQSLVPPHWHVSGRYGTSISYDSNTLVIASERGPEHANVLFDNQETTFDGSFTNFIEVHHNTGSANIYSLEDGDFLYSQSIVFNKEDIYEFSAVYTANNVVYVGSVDRDNTTTMCNINEYNLSANFWKTINENKPGVDYSLIKSVSLISPAGDEHNLDIIDIRQNRNHPLISNIITHTSLYDPAVYTMGEGKINVNPSLAWIDNHVGDVWWDLRNALFLNPHQDNAIYSANVWNSELYDDSITVCEWTESTLKPSEWDKKSKQQIGVSKGITGETLYGDNAFSVRKKYDPISRTFTTYYYYWVRDKSASSKNQMSVNDIGSLLRDPANTGHRFVSLMSPTEIALYNCSDIIGKGSKLNIQYWKDATYKNSNIHEEYAILDSDASHQIINGTFEGKWIDSIVGQDRTGREVPDKNLNERAKYGSLNSPRQGWFRNRIEAAKQLIEKINAVLLSNRISDTRTLDRLFARDPLPESEMYDESVDSLYDLQYVNVSRFKQAKIVINIENGRIISVNVLDEGYGYKVPPVIRIKGEGSGAEFDVILNTKGGIDRVEVISSGNYYTNNDKIEIRNYSVLVLSDESRHNKWTVYQYSPKNKSWHISSIQKYNVSEYWEYIDWYATGIDSNSSIDYLVSAPYDLVEGNFPTGSIIKVKNSGKGGWELYRRCNRTDSPFISVGRENGTIRFLRRLHDPDEFKIRYDSINYDITPYDMWPYVEIRLIMETIKEDIFIDDLSSEYNKLFFNSLHYAFAEDMNLDWAFKTSFLKIKHNVGSLDQSSAYKIDRTDSYRNYIEEVKPYTSKIREYVVQRGASDKALSIYGDFELSDQFYSQQFPTENIELFNYNEADKVWYKNRGYSLVDVNSIINNDDVFEETPQVTVTGDCILPAKATVLLDINRKIEKINIIDPGKGYLSKPNISVYYHGTLVEGVYAYPVLGDTKWRTSRTKIKFDRVGTKTLYNSEVVMEEFDITDPEQTKITLKWPMQYTRNSVIVYHNNRELMGEFSYKNIDNFDKSYKRTLGEVTILTELRVSDKIVVLYNRNIDLITAAQRIEQFYNPKDNQYGKQLPFLMTGIEYKGVVLNGGEFDVVKWGISPWMTENWDTTNQEISYDTEVDGGNLEYTTATDTDSPYIIYDGGALNSINQPGPEELFTGTLIDTFSIRITERDSMNNSNFSIYSFFYEESINTFTLPPNDNRGKIGLVTLNGQLLQEADYTLDLMNNEVQIHSDMSPGNIIRVYILNFSTSNLVGKTQITVPSEKNNIDTGIDWAENTVSLVINGHTQVDSNAFENNGHVIINLNDLIDVNEQVLVIAMRFVTINEDNSNIYSWISFRDLLGIDYYIRSKNITTLNSEVTIDSTSIILDDASTFYSPAPYTNVPGVIYLNGERIEYYGKTGNTLTKLVRGTRGTSIPATSAEGCIVTHYHKSEYLPYKDEIKKVLFNYSKDDVYRLGFFVEHEDEVEVYMGNRRLRKSSIDIYDSTKALDSPEADILVGPEFTIISVPGYDTLGESETRYDQTKNTEGSVIQLNIENMVINPEEGESIVVIRKNGVSWFIEGESNSAISEFLKT